MGGMRAIRGGLDRVLETQIAGLVSRVRLLEARDSVRGGGDTKSPLAGG